VLLYKKSQAGQNSEPQRFTFAKVKLTEADEFAAVASLMAFAIGVGPQKYV
jgi:hypothetical protein